MKIMRTALVRTESKNLRVVHDDWFSNQAEFAAELRANGYKVLKIWNGFKTEEEADEWEFMNRK